MHIKNLDLAKKWEELITKGRFVRKYKDENLDIEYGVQKKPTGGYSFYVSGKENGRSITIEDFIYEKPAGIFQIKYNRLRKLRPGGQDRKPGKQDDLPVGFEKCGFYCQDPANTLSLLVRPLLGTVSSIDIPKLHFTWNVYPNLAPIEPGGHFLLLPSASFPELPHFPQLFTPSLIEDYFDLCNNSEELMIFFNSRHAGATQDHFHLQAVFVESEFPIEKNNYPIKDLFNIYDDKEICCQQVMKLQTKGIPFNLIFLKGKVILFPRNINNEIVEKFPNVLASMEVSGKFIIPNKEAFANATEDSICTALGRIGLALDEIA